MAVVQSSYAERITGPLAFGTPDNMNLAQVDTRVSEDSDDIPFGRAVGQGTADKGCVLSAATATVFAGVSVRDVAKDAADEDEFKRYENVPVLVKGDIWVEADGIVAAGNNVTYETTTGKFGTVAADGTHILVVGARWMTSAASGAAALLRLTGQQAGT